MNGFAEKGLDESVFGEKSGLSQGLKTFDAFPKTKATYTSASRRGGQLTAVLIVISFLLTVSEFLGWYRGHESHTFSVEKGVSHELQINLDVIVHMKCDDLHINVQDAAGDRIFAGELLTRDPTQWKKWYGTKGVHQLHGEGENYEDEEVHVGDVSSLRKKKKFSKTPKVRGQADSCRIYGIIEGNKVQGDFHITARGHGYMAFGEHLDHTAFNFSHVIRELSFGPYYPSIQNPLDDTYATTVNHFYKFQYYLSLIPTVYVRSNKNYIITNQYAVTEQSRMVGERQIPGIFFKFDIEPLLLTVQEERASFLSLVVRLVNVVSGVVVGAGWIYQLSSWASDLLGKRRKRTTDGMLGKKYATVEDANGED
ncbi:MAG: hypothetical protein M1834_005536 [Cirrosporium novae-zelandiae]|nr:MAG: hypothetical protein M1834_005536 [Cirrosporium novae-zelandiae]